MRKKADTISKSIQWDKRLHFDIQRLADADGSTFSRYVRVQMANVVLAEKSRSLVKGGA